MRTQLHIEKKQEMLSLITDVTFSNVPCFENGSDRAQEPDSPSRLSHHRMDLRGGLADGEPVCLAA